MSSLRRATAQGCAGRRACRQEGQWHCLGRDLDGHGVGFRIEDDARLPTLELGAHLSDLLLQGVLALAVIGAFAQHEGFDHSVQRFGGELPVGNEDGLGQSRRTLLRSRRSSM